METGIIARPQQAANIGSLPRVEAPAVASGVKTELRPEATVQQASQSEAVRFEARSNLQKSAALDSAFRDAVRRNTIVDEKTEALVFQTVSEETGEVVRQYPEETVLKLRAYVRGLQETGNANPEREVETRA